MSMTTKIRLSPLICPRCLKTSAHASTRCVRGSMACAILCRPQRAGLRGAACFVPHDLPSSQASRLPGGEAADADCAGVQFSCRSPFVAVRHSHRVATLHSWTRACILPAHSDPRRWFPVAILRRCFPGSTPGSTYGGGSMMTYLIPDLPSWPKVSRSTGTRKSCRACKRTQRRRCSDY